MRVIWSILGKDLAILRRDPFAYVVLLVIPIVLVAFVRPTMEVVLRAEGYNRANGAEQALPGAIVMFAFFAVVYGADTVFREHRWNTWSRLRIAPVAASSIITGKALTPFFVVILQETSLFILGGILFDLRIDGSAVAVVLVAFAFALAVTGISQVVIAFSRTYQQAVALGNLLAIVLAGLGGAITPIRTLPGWVRPLSAATPSYWAMQGFRSSFLEAGGIGAAFPSVMILSAIGLGLAAVGAARFRLADPKFVRAL
jgi:ABC-2 type transport system permease protein